MFSSDKHDAEHKHEAEWQTADKFLKLNGKHNKKFANGGKLPVRADKDGGVATTQEEADEAMLLHFAKVEDSIITTRSGVENMYDEKENNAAKTWS